MKIRRIRSGETTTNGSRTRAGRVIAVFAVLAAIVSGVGVANPTIAYAVEYPTWADVAAARKDEASAKAQIQQIKALLVSLRADAERTSRDAQVKGEAWSIADQKFQEAAYRAGELQKQADAARLVAEESERKASLIAAHSAKSADGANVTVNLLAQAGQADSLLRELEMAGKVSEQVIQIYDQAAQDRNSAQAQTDAAAEARKILEELKLVKEKLFLEAQSASNAAAAALAESEERSAMLQAQLVVLEEDRVATEADFLAGVRARTGTDAQLGAGEISLSGWARPAAGWISSPFGWRVHPNGGYVAFHSGTDVAAGCWSNIYAASSGTVVYAGWNGGYGNLILIDHGNGIQTAYGHIVNGGFLVSSGQEIGVGTHIAEVGTTGNSTGCHLHFEVRENGVAIDNVAFLRSQGIGLG
jgi:murein DD-endopeptidase MepM/ murein hydrolase activator NlpD